MDWQQAEADFESDVLGDGTLSVMFEESAARNAERVAQRYKGGIYDRSLVGSAIPAAPDGWNFAALLSLKTALQAHGTRTALLGTPCLLVNGSRS